MLPKFLKNMDRQARWAMILVFSFFAMIAIGAWLGKSALNLDDGQNITWFENIRDSQWLVPIVVATFVLGSFIGLPQWALIIGMTAAFGLMWGAIGAWGCTLISASVNFIMGRWIGADRIRQYGGERLNRFSKIIRHNGFFASMVVRMVPTGPFVLVNMAAGAFGITFKQFISGTALGIIPKIMIFGLATVGIIGNPDNFWLRLLPLGLAGMIILAVFFLRKKLNIFADPQQSESAENVK